MLIEISLSPLQIKQIASSIDLKDIKEYVENHKEEYEQFLKEQEKNGKGSTIKKYTHFKIVQEVQKLGMQKIYNFSNCIIWNIKNKNGKKELE